MTFGTRLTHSLFAVAILLSLSACETASQTVSPTTSATMRAAFSSQLKDVELEYGWMSDHWKVLDGSWEVARNGLSCTGPKDKILMLRHAIVANEPIRFEYEAKSSDPGDMSLIIGASDEHKPTRDSVFIGFASGGNKKSQIRVPGRDAVVTTDILAKSNKRHNVAVEWSGATITLELDGKVVLEAPCERADFKGERVALYSWNPATFSSFRILSPNGSGIMPTEPAKLMSRLFDEMPAFREARASDHPRLFVKRSGEAELRDRIDQDPALNEALKHVVAIADDIIELEPAEAKMVGRRLLSASRKTLKRVNYLVVAYRHTGDKKYVTRAEEEMLAAADYADWNPSHFLDTAEMTAALALGYDWLYDELDPDARETIKHAIIGKGLIASLKGKHWWVDGNNNWNQVCHGGMTMGALAVMEDRPNMAAHIVERAINNIHHSMDEYAPDGAYPEGPVYWRYGTTYNVLLIYALKSTLGTDFDISKSKGFLESSDYFLHATGPTEQFFNYSDCSATAGIAPAMYWFAKQREQWGILWRQQDALEQYLSIEHNAGSGGNRFFPYLLIWGWPDVHPDGLGVTALNEMPMPKANHWKGDGTTPVGLHRSGWKDNQETYVGLKAGSPGANHAHMDVGSFVMDADGVRWAHDIGGEGYNRLETMDIDLWNSAQDGQRWDIFRLSNQSHNTLVVDGKKQLVKGFAPIIDYSDKGPMPHTTIDMTSVYEDQLASAKRAVGLREDRSVLVQDEIKTMDRETSVRWGMVTKAKVTVKDKRTAILEQDGKQLRFTVLSPADASLELYETEKPPQDYDSLNPGTRMIGFTVKLPASSETQLIVWLQPGSIEGTPYKIQPLNEWK